MYFKFGVSLLTLTAAAAAIQVTSPVSGATWNLSKSHTITWTSTNTDPLTFAIELANLGVYPPFIMKVARGVKTSSGSYRTEPIEKIPEGDTYQFNFLSDDPSKPGILAQSQQFSASSAGVPTNSSSGATSTSINPGSKSSTYITSAILSNSTLKAEADIFATASTNSSGSRAASRTSKVSTTSTSTRRPLTTTADMTSSAPEQRATNAVPALQVYSGANGLILFALALIA
ncbi:hypothetical protein CIHG_01487 [Coccidioides immitis H538.4]|uniref:Yeast cell wall synthesis Kre9/Knh1-like N-terminal domain-containing protein n=1 Tax=Coccidioides immitis H538.4 TaxID=396776 RepID=A0A0J8RI99_COCIT|nr:hypothetical protein CIHG_01487 [Coccidioides immitis H538.4]